MPKKLTRDKAYELAEQKIQSGETLGQPTGNSSHGFQFPVMNGKTKVATIKVAHDGTTNRE